MLGNLIIRLDLYFEMLWSVLAMAISSLSLSLENRYLSDYFLYII